MKLVPIAVAAFLILMTSVPSEAVIGVPVNSISEVFFIEVARNLNIQTLRNNWYYARCSTSGNRCRRSRAYGAGSSHRAARSSAKRFAGRRCNLGSCDIRRFRGYKKVHHKLKKYSALRSVDE